jgi:plastocyanin
MTTLTVNSFLLGVTSAATLSLPAASKNGATGWTGSVNIDQTGGTLWRYAHLSAQTPDAATIKANGATSVPSATGAQSLFGSGLEGQTTYRVSYYHETAGGAGSNIVRSGTFTTDTVGAETGTVTISILDRSNLQIAPEGVFFRAGVTDNSVTEDSNRANYDPSWHDVTYVWSFGDVHAVSDKVVNVALPHNDLNVGYGKEVGHTFTQPGSYTVTCDAYGPSGYIGRGTTSVTVGDPDTLFTGSRTILVGSADANYPGAQVVANINAARELVQFQGQTHRILIQKGHVETSNMGWIASTDFPNIYVSTYGTGARPQITFTNTGFGVFGGWVEFSGKDIVVQGLDARGAWDPQTESGSRAPTFIYGQPLTNASICVDDCYIRDMAMGVYGPSSGGSGQTNCHINNTMFDGWAEYAVFTFVAGDNDIMSCTGVGMVQDPLANSGGSGSIGVGNTQGCFRSNSRGRMYFDVCDLFSRCGWAPSGDPYYQDDFRLNTRQTDPCSVVITRCAVEGGSSLISSKESEGGGHARAHSNILVDKCLLVGARHSLNPIVTETGGWTVRNSILVLPEMPTRSGYNCTIFNIQTTNGGVANGAVPVKVYNNTIIDNRPSSQGLAPNTIFSGDTGKLSSLQEANNVFQFDQQTGREIENANLNNTTRMPTVGGSHAAWYLGIKRSGVPLQAGTGSPVDSVKTYTPNIGSPVIDDASGSLIAHDDFNGVVRSTPDRGAVERT